MNPSGERGAGQAETARAVRHSIALPFAFAPHVQATVIGPTEEMSLLKDLKVKTESASLTWIGRPFHKNEDLLEKALPPALCLETLGTIRRVASCDHSVHAAMYGRTKLEI